MKFTPIYLILSLVILSGCVKRSEYEAERNRATKLEKELIAARDSARIAKEEKAQVEETLNRANAEIDKTTRFMEELIKKVEALQASKADELNQRRAMLDKALGDFVIAVDLGLETEEVKPILANLLSVESSITDVLDGNENKLLARVTENLLRAQNIISLRQSDVDRARRFPSLYNRLSEDSIYYQLGMVEIDEKTEKTFREEIREEMINVKVRDGKKHRYVHWSVATDYFVKIAQTAAVACRKALTGEEINEGDLFSEFP